MPPPAENEIHEPPTIPTSKDSDHQEDDRSNKKAKRKEAETPSNPPEDIAIDEPRMSYSAKLSQGAGYNTKPDPWEPEENITVKDGDITIDNGETGPVMVLSETFKSKLKKLWEKALIIKLIGRSIGYKVLKDKIQSIWSPTVSGQITQATVWVRFEDIPVEWYHTHLLTELGNMVGKTVKVHIHTETAERGKFAKVAIVVDLLKPLQGMVTVEGEDSKVIYEGIPQICFTCGSTSHTQISCPVRTGSEEQTPISTVDGRTGFPTPEPNTVQDPHSATPPKKIVGEWMVVPPRNRRPAIKNSKGSSSGSAQARSEPSTTNRFSPLSKPPPPEPEYRPNQPSSQAQLNLQSLVLNATQAKAIKTKAQREKAALKKSYAAQKNQLQDNRQPLTDISNATPTTPPKTTTQPSIIPKQNPLAKPSTSTHTATPLPNLKAAHSVVLFTKSDHSRIVSLDQPHPNLSKMHSDNPVPSPQSAIGSPSGSALQPPKPPDPSQPLGRASSSGPPILKERVVEILPLEEQDTTSEMDCEDDLFPVSDDMHLCEASGVEGGEPRI
ncbi:hypothetical protein Tsubulata_004999 [Turnera subulata]|uniref:DUF4283 domain-containing protein n=1 Tax=Turnera subulata TaxID=218843 RepID=A0A9Q0JCI0_9ROSI|nr:hypothetical protein Tsubulata_004999 [Turnera subulata]